MDWLSELDRLRPLESDLALLPVGRGPEGKGPQYLGREKGPEEDWTLQACTVDQIRTHRHQPVTACGARTGLHTGPLCVYDFDGRTAFDLGLDPASFVTWQIHRDNNPNFLKVCTRPSHEQIAMLPAQRDGTVEFQGKRHTAPKQGDSKGEALEVFFAGGRQVVVLGQHRASGGNYFWPEGLGPEALTAPPDDWWEFAVHIAQKQLAKDWVDERLDGARAEVTSGNRVMAMEKMAQEYERQIQGLMGWDELSLCRQTQETPPA